MIWLAIVLVVAVIALAACVTAWFGWALCRIASRGDESARRFRKKPVEVEAIHWDGTSIDDVLAFIAADDRWKAGVDDGYVGGPGIGFTPPLGTLDIPTLEGTMTALPGDWIIRGVKGELYPCKSDIFEATYESVLA